MDVISLVRKRIKKYTSRIVIIIVILYFEKNLIVKNNFQYSKSGPKYFVLEL